MSNKINFYYDKSPFYQEILVDGAVGGISPSESRIVMTVYTERAAIPKVTVHELGENGALGPEIADEREGKSGVQRLLQATLHMNIEQAKSVHRWLGHHIEAHEKEKIEK